MPVQLDAKALCDLRYFVRGLGRGSYTCHLKAPCLKKKLCSWVHKLLHQRAISVLAKLPYAASSISQVSNTLWNASLRIVSFLFSQELFLSFVCPVSYALVLCMLPLSTRWCTFVLTMAQSYTAQKSHRVRFPLAFAKLMRE